MIRSQVLALAAIAACRYDRVPPAVPYEHAPPPSAAAREAVIARGKYVATIAGCPSCHGHDLSGDSDAPNITIDVATGIGSWSDWQIITAIRRGVRPDGKRLTPVMPYPFYNHMTDSDALAVVAWIRAQSAVHKRVARNGHPSIEPIDVTAPTGNLDRVDDPLAHGAYLAALMHGNARSEEGWSQLDRDDARALATFVQSLQPHQR